jgi:hypothetical protein
VAVSQNNLELLQRGFGLPSDKGQVIHYGRPDHFFTEPSVQTRHQFAGSSKRCVMTLPRWNDDWEKPDPLRGKRGWACLQYINMGIAVAHCTRLAGMTNDEASKHLRCPKGTILSRLARARERLRARLARRGLTLSAGIFAAVLMRKTPRPPWRIP